MEFSFSYKIHANIILMPFKKLSEWMGRTKCIIPLPPIDCSGEKSGSESFQLCIIISSSTAEQLFLCPQCVVSGREYRAICNTALLLNILNIYSHTPHDITTAPSSHIWGNGSRSSPKFTSLWLPLWLACPPRWEKESWGPYFSLLGWSTAFYLVLTVTFD